MGSFTNQHDFINRNFLPCRPGWRTFLRPLPGRCLCDALAEYPEVMQLFLDLLEAPEAADAQDFSYGGFLVLWWESERHFSFVWRNEWCVPLKRTFVVKQVEVFRLVRLR